MSGFVHMRKCQGACAKTLDVSKFKTGSTICLECTPKRFEPPKKIVRSDSNGLGTPRDYFGGFY